MKSKSLHRLVLTAVFTALVCVATMVITVPTPLGYINIGDGFALTAGWLLGPWYGFAAAGLGSALADVILGYATYVPGTFVIKGLIALIGALLFGMLKNAGLSRLLASVIAEAEMVLGYFLYEAFILSYGMGAAVTVPTNLIQAVGGVVVFNLLAMLLERVHLREKLV